MVNLPVLKPAMARAMAILWSLREETGAGYKEEGLIIKLKRTFTSELKRQVVEELLTGINTPAQITRKHNISGGLIYHWKKQYAKGKFGNELTHEAALKERVKELKCMIGRLTMDNDLFTLKGTNLKKPYRPA